MPKCRLDGDYQFLKDRIFAVTYLDHLNEDDRLNQIKEFNPSEQNINVLTRRDSSKYYYQANVIFIECKHELKTRQCIF